MQAFTLVSPMTTPRDIQSDAGGSGSGSGGRGSSANVSATHTTRQSYQTSSPNPEPHNFRSPTTTSSTSAAQRPPSDALLSEKSPPTTAKTAAEMGAAPTGTTADTEAATGTSADVGVGMLRVSSTHGMQSVLVPDSADILDDPVAWLASVTGTSMQNLREYELSPSVRSSVGGRRTMSSTARSSGDSMRSK
jgi:hypothetical protein